MFGYVFIISLSLIRRSEFFIDNFRDQVKHFRSTVAELIVSCLYDNKRPLFSFTVHRENSLWSIRNKSCFSAQVVVAML